METNSYGGDEDIHFHANGMQLFSRSGCNPFLDLLVMSVLSWMSFGCCGCHTISESSGDISRMVDSLRRSFIYVKNHRGAQTLDVALGITLTKGNLRWISATGVGMKYSFEIQQLSDLCDYVFGLLYNVLHKSNSDRERRFSSLLTYHYNEIIAEDLKRGALPTDANFRFPMLENCSSIANFVLTGSPKDSDACILELNESCNVSNTCWDEETNDFEYFGYKTSHRLLYLLLAARCTKRDPCRSQAIQAMKSVLCGRMLGEAVFLEENYLPFTRDLLLEQIALCGFEGHLEFLRNGWAEKILQSQRPEGCFGFLPLERGLQKACSNVFMRPRRDDALLNGICHTHITAVSFSAMAFHLRAALFESERQSEGRIH